MRRTLTGRSLAVAATAALVLAGAGCSDDEKDAGKPAQPVEVGLSPENVPDNLSVGVLVSLSGQGSDWATAAEGARVAAYRLGLGDVDV